MNIWTGLGRLSKDPEIKEISSTQIGNFTIAVDRKFKKDGQPDADFIDCVCFGKTAEFVSKYFTKGMRVGVSGSLQIRSWNDKDGVKRYKTEVIVDSVDFADGKSDTSGNKSSKPKNDEEEFSL